MIRHDRRVSIPLKEFEKLWLPKSVLRLNAFGAPSPYLNQLRNRRSLTLFTSPSIINTENIFEPPELMSGKGIPVTGMRPTTIPTFTSKWNSNSVATPMQTYIPERSGAIWAFWTICMSNKKYKPRTTTTPTNPCSSAKAEKMKGAAAR